MSVSRTRLILLIAACLGGAAACGGPSDPDSAEGANDAAPTAVETSAPPDAVASQTPEPVTTAPDSASPDAAAPETAPETAPLETAAADTAPTTSTPSASLGRDWTVAPPLPVGMWDSFAYGDGVWIGLAAEGAQAIRSTDGGESWTVIEMPSRYLIDIAHGDGVWVVVGYDRDELSGEYSVIRSLDGGVTWETIAAPSALWRSVGYGDGVWIATSLDSLDPVMRSTDGGASWATVVAPDGRWVDVEYGDGVWLASGVEYGEAEAQLMRSADAGLSWSAIPIAEGSWTSVSHGDGVWILVGNAFDDSQDVRLVARSTNGGITWEPVTDDWFGYGVDAAYGDGVWVIVAPGDGSSLALWSTDGGVTLNASALPLTQPLLTTAFGGDRFLVAGQSSVVISR